MDLKLRKHGNPPFEVVVIHGGPGAPGTVRPVACELAVECGVLEPLLMADSIEGQMSELEEAIDDSGSSRVILVGWSWGAMLGFMFAARHPEMVQKLILVGSAVFEERYAGEIERRRLARLGREKRANALCLMKALENPCETEKDRLMRQLGELLLEADNLAPLTSRTEETEVSYDVFENVWKEAQELRRSGRLLEMGKRIRCPVTAIHGDYDPHPAEGVQRPLSKILGDFRFILIENCGHQPWIEGKVKDRFYSILMEELQV